ncbi:MAG: DCC1-like thiol-disulfide oxidoreductase family protein [Planctomycetaceae bacterium]
MSETDKSILFFDGVCGLCNRCVDFALRRDPRGRILFATLQGTTAAELLTEEDGRNLDTVIFFEHGTVFRRSSAIVKLLQHLGGFWTVLSWLLWIIPLPIRNLGYRLIAKIRYRLLGRKETCRLPTPDERQRFLD